jgi:thiamine pyrophosphokinase
VEKAFATPDRKSGIDPVTDHDPMKAGGAASPVFPRRGKRAVVLCDGPPPPVAVVEYWLAGADLFLCADRAGYPYDHLPRPPDVVIGDFDSLSQELHQGWQGPTLIHSSEQDTTDSEKALLHAAEAGCVEAVLLGATGWLLDHTLYNCALPERFAGRLAICLASARDTAVRVGPGEEVRWRLPAGTLFSLMPLAGPVRGIEVAGAAYPLAGGRAVVGGRAPATISNRVSAPLLRLRVGTGSLLVSVRHRGPAALVGQ